MIELEECKNCKWKIKVTNATNEKVSYMCKNKDRLDAIIHASVYPDQPCNWFEEE